MTTLSMCRILYSVSSYNSKSKEHIVNENDLMMYRELIATRDKRILELEAAIRLATYKDVNAVHVAWRESKDLSIGNPIFMDVHNT